MAGRRWTEFETHAALELYLRTPFGRIHARNSEIIDLASTLKRSPNSIALKLANFANLDKSLPQQGMSNVSSMDRKVWDELFKRLSHAGHNVEPINSSPPLSAQENPQADFDHDAVQGLDTIRLGKVRVNQGLFRKIVLSSYDYRCAITGITRPELLIAGHIKPWAVSPRDRLNPHNGICLNRLHDAAFESEMMTFHTNGKAVYSSQLDLMTKEKLVAISEGEYLRPPKKFRPDPAYLEYHRDVRFRP